MLKAKIFLILLVLGVVIFYLIPDSAQAQATFIRGDVNCDGVVDTVDLRLIFQPIPRVNCSDRKDVDDNELFSTADSIYLANYLFSGGPPPPHPFPSCGIDTTPGFSCYNTCCCTLATQCNDGIDNDGDGLIDFPADPSCVDACDAIEAYTECDDGIDNDGDGLWDYRQDCGCENAYDSTEAPNPVTACSDGIDNDGDGRIDLADAECNNSCDTSELCDTPCCYYAGDGNKDGKLTLPDIIVLVNHVFKGAPQPNPKCLGDCNNSNSITLPDIIILIGHLFKGAPKPSKDVDGTCCR